MTEAIKYRTAPGPDKNVSWRDRGFFYPNEVISPERKQEIFAEDIVRINDRFADYHERFPGYGVITPSNLLDHLVILGPDDFRAALEQRGTEYSEMIPGFCDTNSNTAIVSYANVEAKAKECGVSIEDSLRHIGVHELWHTRETNEQWLPVSSREGTRKILRRRGVVTLRPDFKDDSEHHIEIGMHALEEGITTYLTTETTGLDNFPTQIKQYKCEVEVLTYLIKDIGLDPFFLAQYSKAGFRAPYREMAKAFSPYVLQLIFTKMGEARSLFMNQLKAGNMKVLPDYSAVFEILGYS